MLTQVEKKDKAAWMEYSKELSKGLQEEIKNAPTGKVMKELLDEQVTLIKSIPLAAAQRVHDLAIEATEGGKRASEVAELIKQSTQVSVSKANTIARTEVSRASSVLTQARAMHIGSEGYIWRTTGDSDVRESHKKMNGKFVKWTEPPALLEGKKIYHAHAGRAARKRVLAELMAELVTTGTVHMPDGKVLEAAPRDWIETVKWLYAHIDGPPKQEIEQSGGLTIKVIYADPTDVT